MAKSWRDLARPMIAEVIRCCGQGCTPAFVKKAVMATYPWGERKYWPYKIWCDEARRQLQGPRRGERVCGPLVEPDPRQGELLPDVPGARLRPEGLSR